MKINVGIFFGGPSRERELSFMGSRTVFDTLDRALFEPLPIFVDSHRNFILLNWRHLFQPSIRDFYPSPDALPPSPHRFRIYLESLGQLDAASQEKLISRVGRRVEPGELPQLINVALLVMHGSYGADGQLQRLLEELRIPYTGSGIAASKTGKNKARQHERMTASGFQRPVTMVINRKEWLAGDSGDLFEQARRAIGLPLVVRPAGQGSAIGVSVVEQGADAGVFRRSVDRAFFREEIPAAEWVARDDFERAEEVRLLSDLQDGLGYPLVLKSGEEQMTVYHPEELLESLNARAANVSPETVFTLEAPEEEEEVLLESFIRGREFSCIVLHQDDGSPVALAPTEIHKGREVFDYRAKYLPGGVRTTTPMDLPADQIALIRQECERLFTVLGLQAFARIDGFFTADGQIFLNDPNTTASFLPSSILYRQLAAIGLDPSQWLTYLIRSSLQERYRDGADPACKALLKEMDEQMTRRRQEGVAGQGVGIILGGSSSERHLSLETGRNVFFKLAGSEHYRPFLYFLKGDTKSYELYTLPLSFLLEKNVDEIAQALDKPAIPAVLSDIRLACAAITERYGTPGLASPPRRISFDELAQQVDEVFIALHGRPGEDGQIQMQLDARGIAYNGSGVKTSSLLIDKYRTLQKLKLHDFPVPDQLLLSKEEYLDDPDAFYEKVERAFKYPLVAKPVDESFRPAIRVLPSRQALEAYIRILFRNQPSLEEDSRRVLRLKPREEFPACGKVLFESLITADGADRFVEISGALITHFEADGKIRYEVFEPAEVLREEQGRISAEKYLAGEHRTITPARFGIGGTADEEISLQVRTDLERAARLLQVEGYARLDAFVRVRAGKRPETVIVDIDTLPELPPNAGFFQQAACHGYQPGELIAKILSFGWERRQRHIRKTPAIAETPPPAATTAAFTAENTFTKQGLQPKKTDMPTTSSFDAGPGNKPEASGPALPPKNGRDGFLQKTAHFLRSGIFLRNLASILLFLILFLLLTTTFLKVYTRHGESMQMDDYVGMQLDEATRKAERRNFRVAVIESDYDPDRTPFEVYAQSPPPLTQVKEKRTIYLYVYGGTRKQVPLPTLKGGNDEFFRYQNLLRRRKIIMPDEPREKIFDSKLEENTILYLYHNGRKITPAEIEKGYSVTEGDEVEAIVTTRVSDYVRVPDLVCERFDAAQFYINSSELVIGEISGVVGNRNAAYIWKQDPAAGMTVRKGTAVNLSLQEALPDGCPE